MRIVAIIPARFASTRLPGKPLLARTGKPLIQHVVERVRQARLDGVYVATDDQRIAAAVAAFGGQAVMTRPEHPSGTDRLAEAATRLGLADEDVVLNIQGDEPEIEPACIDRLANLLLESDAPMATLAAPLSAEAAQSPHNVKVVLACDGSALYFSRAKIPFERDAGISKEPGTATAEPGTSKDKSAPVPGSRFPDTSVLDTPYLLHLGAYAYRKRFLLEFAALPPTPLERLEKLEQLRVLEHGRRIAVAVVPAATPGIDTEEDYRAFVARQVRKTT